MAMPQDKIAKLAYEGKYDAALKACHDNIPDIDRSQFGSFITGYCYFHLGRNQEAATAFDRALKLAPKDSHTMYYTVLATVAAGNSRAALRFAAHHVANWPSAFDSNEFKGILEKGIQVISIVEDEELCVAFRRSVEIAWPNIPAELQVEWLYAIEGVGRAREHVAALNAEAQNTSLMAFAPIVSVSEAVEHGNGAFKARFPAETIQFAHFKGAPFADTRSEATAITGNEGYVATLDDVIVCGVSGAVLGKDGSFISDNYAHREFHQYVDMRADNLVLRSFGRSALIKKIKVDREIDTAINLSGVASNHFGHWFSEYLPRLRHFESVYQAANLPILVNEDMPQSHFDLLAAVCENPVIRVGRTEAVRVKNLWVAPTITFYPFDLKPGHDVPIERQACWSAAAMAYLRSKVLEKPNFVAPPTEQVAHEAPVEHQSNWFASPFSYLRERVFSKLGLVAPQFPSAIYLSRKNSSWGRPANEDEFLKDLKCKHIWPVYLEHMSFKQQVRTLQSASIIVAPTGSALNMLVFARPDARILIFSQRFPHNWGGWVGPIQELGILPQVAMMNEGSQSSKHAAFNMRLDVLEAWLSEETA
ncbi:Capsular polysaccharide biosynthesis protein-like protein [Roseobacter sp. AzwK-3b]|uniref:glycosyltransferase 61 family protein n=1 Tax=Roseobacter sp. AzwK-3b TaxID=351016 RepID=UPI000156A06E|nr:glycosyltransferase 61 family protein [Roseobacter sp. AzwK-3b]EDM70641.1 Capsular polysaccharide biosynthesis protein-like protein [Roseobacter sp. AzwK-3b]